MQPITLFHSTALPGATMNRYGAVILKSGIAADKEDRAIVLREARTAGLFLASDLNESADTGLVWFSPPSPGGEGLG